MAGLALAFALAAGPAFAQARFAGQWDVVTGAPAPWAKDPKDATDGAEARRFIGQRLVIGVKTFKAPRPLGCARPTYAFRNAQADTLFEGALNYDGKDKPADPVAAARALGMTQKTVVGMTASCSELEFFLIAPDTVLFGLNNRIFTLKRAR